MQTLPRSFSLSQRASCRWNWFGALALASFLTINSASAALQLQDDESDFAVTGEIPVKNWQRLMEETHTKPLVLPPPALFIDPQNALYQAWINERLLKPALASYAPVPAKAEARALLTRMTRLWTREERGLLDARQLDGLLKLSADPALPPFLCFVMARQLQVGNRWEQAPPLYTRAADASAGESYPAAFRIMAQSRVLQDEQRHPERHQAGAAETKLLNVLREALAKPWSPEVIEHCGIIFFEGVVSVLAQDREEKIIEVYRNSALPGWLRLAQEGKVRQDWALRERRKGDQNMEGAFDAAKVREQLASARRLLARAWELHPAEPWAAEAMMEVVQQERKLARTAFDFAQPDELRLWFDRAIAATGDDTSAYQSILRGYLPEYGGSLPKMLAFGRACAETRRYDTLVPSYFPDAVARIAAQLTDWRSIYRQPGVSALLLESRQKRLAAVAATPVALLERGQLAFEAWACGDYSLAARTLMQMKQPDGSLPMNQDVYAEAWRIEADLDFVIGDALSRGGPEHERYAEAGRQLARGEGAEAEAGYRQLMEKAVPAARPLLRGDVRLAQFHRQLAAGEWAALPLDEPLCWRHPNGQFAWRADDKRVRLTTPDRASRTLFRGRLGERFELRGHFVNSHGPDHQSSGFAILSGHTPFGAGQDRIGHWSVRVDCVGTRTNSVQSVYNFALRPQAEQKKIPWQADNVFLYHYDKGIVEFTLNDRKLLEAENVGGPSEFTGSGAIGFSVIANGPGGPASVADLWQVEARRLP